MNWFKKHKVLTVIGVIVLLVIIGGAAGGGSNKTNNNGDNGQQEAQTETKAEAAKIGAPANDGRFQFTVKSIECGKAFVGANEYLTKQAQGQFCLLNITVKNIGDGPQSLFADNQYLFNASGQKYSADSTATTYAAPQGSTWYSEINPGNSVEGAIVFDVPKDVTPTIAELHDSAFSGGVKVTLQ